MSFGIRTHRWARRTAFAAAVSLGAIIFVPGTAWAEEEPNDTMATALPLPIGRAGIGDGEIGPGGDVDYYKFDSAANKTYVIEVQNVASVLGRMELRVYNSDATLLVEDDYCRNGTGNACGRVQLTVPTAGTYYVRVEAYSQSATGTYAVRALRKYDEGATWDAAWEPDDVRALAPEIKIGRTRAVDRIIQPRNPNYYTVDRDYDTLRFDAPGARNYVIEVFDVASVLGRMELRLYNSAGTLLVQDDYCRNGSGHVCGRVQVSIPSAGTYFLRMNAYSSSSSGTYSVRVLQRYDQGATWDSAWEPDDVAALAPEVEIGRAGGVSRVIHPLNPDFYTVARDIDTVHFEAKRAGTFVVELYNVASVLGRMELRVYDSAGTLLVQDDYCRNGTGNVCARVRVAVPLAGDYFVRMNAYSSSASGTYRVRVLPRYDQGLTWGGDEEVNDTPDLAYGLKLSRSLQQVIYPRSPNYYTVAADFDYYRLAAKKNKNYVVQVSDVSESLDETALTIYDSAGAVIADSSSCGDTDSVEVICNQLEFRASLGGDYFLRVRPTSSTANGSFAICARLSTKTC